MWLSAYVRMAYQPGMFIISVLKIFCLSFFFIFSKIEQQVGGVSQASHLCV